MAAYYGRLVMWKVKRMKPARIVVLVIALAAGAVAALLAGRSDPPPPPAQAPVAKLDTVDVLVAANDIGIGHTVSAGDMRWQTWPTAAASNSFIRKNDRPDAIEQLAGTIARAPLSAGEPVREAKLIRADGSGYMAAILPAGMRAVSTQISPETGAGGFILPNDHVDVILSRRDREAEKAAGVEMHTSETILTNVRVLAIDQTVEEKGGQRVVVGKTATLELSSRQAETLARAQQMGTLSLALRSIVDQSKSTPEAPDDSSGRRSGINVVRFGITTMTNPK
jgi:pilus assembly protein CpaB